MRQDALIVAVIMLPKGTRLSLPASEWDTVDRLPRAHRACYAYESGRVCESVEAQIEERRVECVRWRDATEEEVRAVRERGTAPTCGPRSVTL